MARGADIIVIGGGIAGLSGAAAMAADAQVVLLEAEEHIGFHTSGRSATMFHYALGNPLIRRLTHASRATFDNPPEGFGDNPLGQPISLLVHAREEELDDLAATRRDMQPFATIEELDEEGLRALCPLLRVGADGSVAGLADHDCLKVDQHALMQGYARQLKARGGAIVTGARVSVITRRNGIWRVESEAGESFEAPVLVNAAGAWSDAIAGMAGIAPLGLHPLRRTIITFDAPDGTDLHSLPFVKTVADWLYFGAESGRLFASPMDEEPSEPCDSQPDDIGIATAAFRVEERTHAKVRAIRARWSGLRTFTPDRNPAVGFAPGAEGFFWLAGQGGAGLQTAPALSRIAAGLVRGEAMPIGEVDADDLNPGRFFGKAT